MFRGMYSIPPNPSDSLHHNDDVVDSKCVPKMDTLCLGNDHFHAEEVIHQQFLLRHCAASFFIPCYGVEYFSVAAYTHEQPVLIEATANQVNQYGGYTGMRPADYYRWVRTRAEELGADPDLVILAGDHLGPLTFADLPEEQAMQKAKELVYEYARAGFTKIHLDTSMKVADDPAGPLATGTVARRGKELYDVAMKAYRELLKEVPDAPRPVFVIGSEVPIPGGAQEAEDTLAVTKPEDFADTVETYLTFFGDAMEDVIAVVVQPGVEFGDDQIFLYDHDKAAALTAKLKDYPGLVFEGHSTDYQSRECLRQMVEDGVGILKVGPALTYAMREAIFALSMIEKELLPEDAVRNKLELNMNGTVKQTIKNCVTALEEDPASVAAGCTDSGRSLHAEGQDGPGAASERTGAVGRRGACAGRAAAALCGDRRDSGVQPAPGHQSHAG